MKSNSQSTKFWIMKLKQNKIKKYQKNPTQLS
jgi:hypothetical protein